MTKKKKIIILVLGISIALVGVLALVFNKDLLNKLRSSVIDPTTGDVCIEDAKSTNIIHENGETVKKILDDLYAEKDSTCSTGYSCHKPAIPTKVEPESCFTLDSSHIMYSNNDEEITVENAIKELYTIYNSASFCPQKYCKPNTYTVNLDKNGGTSQGTSKIYEKFDTAVYLDSTENNKMTASANPITKPQKVYTITYEANGQGASYTGSPTTSSATFNGYFTKTSGGTKMIDENGYIIPSNFPNNKYSNEATLYAQYSNTAIKLPAITKSNATCKWAEGSASGTQYAGGTSRTISGNTKYYAVCEFNTYTVNLDKNGGTSQGTSKIYEKFDTAVYLDSTENNKMTASANPITKPQKVYTITYEANGQGASYTGSPTTSSATFNGYFTKTSGGTKMIDENGYIIPSNFPNNKYSNEATLYAQYSNTAIKLPAITKSNATCKWAEGSASGTQYAGGTSRTISGNTKYYAVCVANPIITVINNICDENGNNCTQASKVTYQKAPGTTETISATAQSGYNNPGSYSVTYNANHTLTFNHTKVLNVTPVTAVYNSPLLRANHTSGHTDIYLPNGSRSYGYIVPPDHSSAIQWPRYSSTSSTTFSGFPYIIVLNDTGSGASDYVAAFSGVNYSNGVKGTYFVRTCNSSGLEESCTADEPLRPYFEIKYDLNGGSGDSSNQSKYSGQSITLHSAPTRSGYTFKGWAAQTQGGDQCYVCNGGSSGTDCTTTAYYAAGRSLNGQEWNVGNKSWPCASKEMYVNNTNTVYLRALWNRNAWTTYN